jgi:carbamoyl-phosphate synthase small subunit
MKGLLVLEDGKTFPGESFGAPGLAPGEVVFNTSLSGYQEIVTDPSYCRQIVAMTYPLIGNYGVNEADAESARCQVAGLVVREYCDTPSNWRSEKSLGTYLEENGIVALTGVDTRSLTRHIRTGGAMRAVIAAGDYTAEGLRQEALKFPGLAGSNLVEEVSCPRPFFWERAGEDRTPRFQVTAFDFGTKYNIFRLLSAAGCNVRVVPATTSAEAVLAGNPDGIFLSNGPGDPSAVPHIVAELKKLIGKKPIFGICFGHQLLGIALGGKTYKLKFGHRGGNQPVQDVRSGRVLITSQNHGFCVDEKSLDPARVEVSHINLNDRTVEGLRHKTLPIFCVQYHPEAAPGPHDARVHFNEFIQLMEKNII